jgi:hypothetical protein
MFGRTVIRQAVPASPGHLAGWQVRIASGIRAMLKAIFHTAGTALVFGYGSRIPANAVEN